MKLDQISNKDKIIFLKNLDEIKKNIAYNFSFLNLDDNTKEELFQKALNTYLSNEKNFSLINASKKIGKYLNNE